MDNPRLMDDRVLMDNSRLIQTALRCYPAQWRRRHGDEAVELAALLIADGHSPSSIAFSYLGGAARAWLQPRSGRRLGMVACALLVAACSLGLSAELVASAAPARAAAPAKAAAPASHAKAAGNTHCQLSPATTRQVISWGGVHDRSC